MALFSIRLPGTAVEESDDVVAQLLGCHERIRRFVDLAARLADQPDAQREQVAAAAEALVRYFTIGLPLHAADEDESVEPRLRAIASADLHCALNSMTADHRLIDRVLAEAIPVWYTIDREPTSVAKHREALARASAQLEALFLPHLAAEEAVIFPELRRLDPVTLAEIRSEQRQRRAGSRDQMVRALPSRDA